MTILKATDKSSGIVKRETTATWRGQQIMVELRPVDTQVDCPMPDALIVLRLKGTRRGYPLKVVTAYEFAVLLEARRISEMKRQARKERLAARRNHGN